MHPSSFAQGFIANEAIASINAKYDPSETMPLQPLSIVEIAALANVFAGDFDSDNNVNGNDLARWLTNYGQSGADADGDGDADGADYLVWQKQYSTSGGVSAAAIPEPTSLSILAFGMLAIGYRGCRPTTAL